MPGEINAFFMMSRDFSFFMTVTLKVKMGPSKEQKLHFGWMFLIILVVSILPSSK